jgi:hypothetical protein
MPEAPWSPVAFEERYARSTDPWSFETSAYEQARYDAIEAVLRPSPHRYRSGFEPACSIGVLTERLAGRCDTLLATDVAPSAAARARRRCGGRAGVTVAVGSIEGGPYPAAPPDLIVLSEVGYYLARDQLAVVVGDLAAVAAPGAEVVACHWTGESPDHQLHGREVHEVLAEVLGSLAVEVQTASHDGFLLDAWRFAP